MQYSHILFAFTGDICYNFKSLYQVGGLAQLGEHLHGMQGVTSSSLVSSTILFSHLPICHTKVQ